MTSRLKEIREAAGYSLEDIASKLNIRKQYLLALEEENYQAIPGKIYVEGYKKMYYEFLKIDMHLDRSPLLKAESPDGDETALIAKCKYRKYILPCSTVLLVVAIALYNFLKNRAL